MKIFDKKYEIKIAKEDLEDANLSSRDFSKEIKKRAFIDILGARLAMKFLFSQKIQVNNLYSLYSIHSVLNELDIADIYFNGIKMDVRLVFNKEEIFVPKSHFEYNVLPDLYLVLSLNSDMSSVDFLGFFEPERLDKEKANKDFYFYEFENLQKPNELAKFLENFTRQNDFEVSKDSLEKAKELFLSLADKEISQIDKVFLFQQLAHDFSLREKMVEFENFEFISNEVVKCEDLLQDSVLNVVAAQDIIEKEPLSAKEEQRELKEALGDGETQDLTVGLDLLITEAESSVYLLGEEEPLVDSSLNNSESINDVLESYIDVIEEVEGSLDDIIIDKESNVEFEEKVEKANSEEVIGIKIDNILEEVKDEDGIVPDVTLKESMLEKEVEILDELVEESIETDIEQKFEEAKVEIDTNGVFVEYETLIKEEGPKLDEITVEEDDKKEIPELQGDLLVEIIEEEAQKSDEEKNTEEIVEEVLHEEEMDEIIQPEIETSTFANVEAGILSESYELEEASQEPEYLKQAFADAEGNFSTEITPEEFTNIYLKAEEACSLGNLPNIESLDYVEVEELPAYLDSVVSAETAEDENDNVLSLDDFDKLNDVIEEKEPIKPIEQTALVEDNVISFDEDNALAKETIPEQILSEDSIDYVDEGTIENIEQINIDKDVHEEMSVVQNVIEHKEEECKVQEIVENELVTAEVGSDDILLEVDDFLNNIELSKVTFAGLPEELANDFSEFELKTPIKDRVSGEESLEASIDELISQTNSQDNNVKKDEDNKDLLKTLFNKENIKEKAGQIFGMNLSTQLKSFDINKNKKMVIAASIASVVIASAVIGGVVMSNKKANTNLANMNGPQAVAPIQKVDAVRQQSDFNNQSNVDENPALGNKQVLQPVSQALSNATQQQTKPRDMSEAVSQAFSSEPVEASISKVAWEVPEELAYNDNFRKYLQAVGRNLKLNLQNALLLATQMSYSNKVIVDLEISKNGSLKSSNFVISSGSKQIDKIVLQNIKETLKYIKMPSSEIKDDFIIATLIINF